VGNGFDHLLAAQLLRIGGGKISGLRIQKGSGECVCITSVSVTLIAIEVVDRLALPVALRRRIGRLILPAGRQQR
jgi:hypothetical protein